MGENEICKWSGEWLVHERDKVNDSFREQRQWRMDWSILTSDYSPLREMKPTHKAPPGTPNSQILEHPQLPRQHQLNMRWIQLHTHGLEDLYPCTNTFLHKGTDLNEVLLTNSKSLHSFCGQIWRILVDEEFETHREKNSITMNSPQR